MLMERVPIKEEFTVKNWVGFHENLKKDYDIFNQQKEISKDPIQQYLIGMKRDFIQRLMVKYEDYLKTIGSDHGSGFSKTLEKEYYKLKETYEAQTEEYMKKTYSSLMSLSVLKLKEFNNFIKQ